MNFGCGLLCCVGKDTEMTDLAAKIRNSALLQPRALPADYHYDVLRLQAALTDVLDIHKPVEWFEECTLHQMPMDDDPGHDEYWDTHRYVGPEADMVACDETKVADCCVSCTPKRTEDDSDLVVWPCPTVVAVAAALGVREDGPEGE